MALAIRSLSEDAAQTTSFTRQQNRAVLIAGLVCACFSVLATLVTLRWFLLMKRTFRHKLILFLILSDTFKALWYFVFPVVVFSRGPVASSAGFCQATGFFLSIGIESSDFAILMIALHSILYIFHPPTRSGEIGGLYRWRKYMYPLWVALPILMASLAFINHHDAYATAGTFCYLPRRPIWYRLALSWIPRYCILTLIVTMYAAVYIYVTIKFRSFGNLQDSDEKGSSNSISRRSSLSDDDIAPDESVTSPETPKRSMFGRPGFSRNASFDRNQPSQPRDPWDEVSFITSKPLQSPRWQPGVQTSDFAINNFGTGTASPHTREPLDSLDPSNPNSRKVSNCPTENTQYTGETVTTSAPPPEAPTHQQSQPTQKPDRPPKTKDPLRQTRKAIRKQLRYLFIYPAVYVLMWAFPFAAHCLLYDDYYVQNPIFWLSIVSTCMFSLQAGVDCVVFSWREKPWRKIPDNHRFSVVSVGNSMSFMGTPRHGRSTWPSAVGVDGEGMGEGTASSGMVSGPSSRAASANWWEAEGKKRKDSVWMGTDQHEPGDVMVGRRNTVALPSDMPSPLEEEDDDGESQPSGRLSQAKEEHQRSQSRHEIPN